MAKPESQRAKNPTKHSFSRVGLPRVPSLYGLKPRKTYLPWSHAEDRLKHAHNYWVCTTRPNGRPHGMPVSGLWLNGALYFSTARASRKGLNIARNPAVSVHLESADDVVILEGEAREISDEATIAGIDAGYRAKYKMPLWQIPENVIFGVRPRVVLAWTEKDFPKDATRWEFDSEAG